MSCECDIEDSGEECWNPDCECDEDYCHDPDRGDILDYHDDFDEDLGEPS